MVHSERHLVAGLVVNVYTLHPFTHSDRPIFALFFLHGRNGSAFKIEDYTKVILESSRSPEASRDEHDLVIITFDHRNHGSRLCDSKSNSGWNKDPTINNERHALDMYAIQTGTALDVSFLIDFLPAYLFPAGNRCIQTWGVAGKSLGGHSTWLALGQDDRISFGAPIIACPDYLKLMRGRAIKSAIPVAPPYFPTSLIELVRQKDPASRPFNRLDANNPYLGKKVLVLSGAADKLVPWEASKDFVDALAVGPSGIKRIVVQQGIGHECTQEMLEEVGRFIGEEYLRKTVT